MSSRYVNIPGYAFKKLRAEGNEDSTFKPTIWRRFADRFLSMTPWKKSFLLGEEELVPTYRFCRDHLVPIDSTVYDEKPTCPVGHQTRQWLIVQGGLVLASASDKQTTWYSQPRLLSDFAHRGTAQESGPSHRQKKPSCE